MANHKRRGPKSTRSGCLMCKPHKHQAESRLTRQELKAQIDEAEGREAACEIEEPLAGWVGDASTGGWENYPVTQVSVKGENRMSEDRIFIGWPGGYFMTSLGCEDFQAEFLSMVSDLGPPSVVEFRAAHEGWVEGGEDAKTC